MVIKKKWFRLTRNDYLGTIPTYGNRASKKQNKSMAVTIRQIADKLQLSHSTVSRVLNNKSNVFIAEETSHRVRAAAQEMGYRPNLAARSLRDARSNMVGIFASPYMGIWQGSSWTMASALAAVLHKRDLHIFFALVSADGTEQQGLPVWQFDGAILLQRPMGVTMDHLLAVNRPYVAINEWVRDGVSILADEADGVRQAMDYLWELGHRTIAYAGPTQWHFEHYSVSERHEAYLGYFSDRDIPPVPGHDFVPEEAGINHDPDLRTEWLRRAVYDSKATAVLAYDHFVLLEVLTAAQRSGLRIPDDLSLICFNDEGTLSRLNPPITVISPQSAMMGQIAGNILLARMDAGEGALPQSNSSLPTLVRVPQELIVRQSTGPAPQRPALR